MKQQKLFIFINLPYYILSVLAVISMAPLDFIVLSWNEWFSDMKGSWVFCVMKDKIRETAQCSSEVLKIIIETNYSDYSQAPL